MENVHAVAPLMILMGAFVRSWFAGTDLNIFQLQAYGMALLMLVAAALLHKRIKMDALAHKDESKAGKRLKPRN